MDTPYPHAQTPQFGFANFIAADALARDQSQSTRLHEPAWMQSRTDPMTGRDIVDLSAHPFLVDGNLTIYFESEQSRREYLDMPTDHPFRLVDNPSGEGYDEG